jgi:hypothetical protein
VCFDFLYNFCLNIIHSNKKQVRCDKKCVLVFMYNVGYSCQILMKPESKNAEMSNFMKIRRVGAEFFREDGQMDRQTWRNS